MFPLSAYVQLLRSSQNSCNHIMPYTYDLAIRIRIRSLKQPARCPTSGISFYKEGLCYVGVPQNFPHAPLNPAGGFDAPFSHGYCRTGLHIGEGIRLNRSYNSL